MGAQSAAEVDGATPVALSLSYAIRTHTREWTEWSQWYCAKLDRVVVPVAHEQIASAWTSRAQYVMTCMNAGFVANSKVAIAEKTWADFETEFAQRCVT